MAKKTNKQQKNKKPPQRSSPPPRNPIYMGLLGLLAGAWVVWRLEPSQGLGMALLIGAAVCGAWLIFVLALNRSQRRSNDD